MGWFSGDQQNQENYGGSTQPLKDAVDKVKQTTGQSSDKGSNGGHKQR